MTLSESSETIGSGSTIDPGSEQSTAIHRNIWIAAWTAVGLFALGSLLVCVWYSRALHAADVAAADRRVSQAVADSQQWMAGEEDLAKWKLIEISLIVAISHENVSDKHEGQTALERFRQHAEATRKLDDARQWLKQGNGHRAAIVLMEYLGLEQAKNKAEAQWILEELMVANSDKDTLTTLLGLDEASFLKVKKSGTISEPRVTRPELKDILNETVKRILPLAENQRLARLAEQKRLADEKERIEKLRADWDLARLNEERERLKGIQNRLARLVPNPTELETFLQAGEFNEGLLEFQTQLLDVPDHDTVRFQLGLTQFFSSIERLGQSLHRFGVKQSIDNTPFIRLPVPENPTPDSITYVQFRRILNDFITDLDRVNSTLALIKADDVAVSLRLGVIRFDMNGDGKAEQDLMAILKQLHEEEFAFLRGNEALMVDFDRGDVTWLRIYCQLMAAVLDFALAFDLEPGFDQGASKVFDNPQVGNRNRVNEQVIQIVEPRRLGRFRHRLILITELNHEMWRQVRAENDKGLEWLPNSKQQSVLGFTVSDPLVDSWLDAMTEVGAALRGERVIPDWIFQRAGKGLNLKILLEDPPVIDQPLINNFPNNIPDKYFTEGVAFNLNTLFVVYQNYVAWFD